MLWQSGGADSVHCQYLEHCEATIWGFSYWSLFESVYLVMHWSDSNDNKKTIVLQTVFVMSIFYSLVPTHSDAHLFKPRTSTKNHRVSRFEVVTSRYVITGGVEPKSWRQYLLSFYLQHFDMRCGVFLFVFVSSSHEHL